MSSGVVVLNQQCLHSTRSSATQRPDTESWYQSQASRACSPWDLGLINSLGPSLQSHVTMTQKSTYLCLLSAGVNMYHYVHQWWLSKPLSKFSCFSSFVLYQRSIVYIGTSRIWVGKRQMTNLLSSNELLHVSLFPQPYHIPRDILYSVQMG